jgi:hypothetical protein
MSLLTAKEITINKDKLSLGEVLCQIDVKLSQEAKQHRFKVGKLGSGIRMELPSWIFEEMVDAIEDSLNARGFSTVKETKEIGYTHKSLKHYLHIFWYL